jgi:hypothetical protein
MSEGFQTDLSGDAMFTFLLPLVMFPFVASPAVSNPMPQPNSSGNAQNSAAAGSAANLDAASTEMQGLVHAISGRWVIDLKFEPSSEMPNGANGKGEELWKPLADGLVLSDEEKIQLPQATVHLLGLIWWDQTSKEFRGMECINQNTHACNAKAAASQDVAIKWDGRQLTIEEPQTSADGKRALWHETFSEITPTSFLQVGETWESGGRHRKVVTVHGTRVPE